MKKLLLAGLAILLLGSLAWLLAVPHAGTGYPNGAVESVLARASSSAGAEIVEVRIVSAQLRSKGRTLDALKSDIDRSLGRPIYDNLRSYQIVRGGSKLDVVLWSSLHDTGRIEIRPEPGAAGFAADLHADFLEAFPEIRCKIVGP
jgi:hypothetical protein